MLERASPVGLISVWRSRRDRGISPAAGYGGANQRRWQGSSAHLGRDGPDRANLEEQTALPLRFEQHRFINLLHRCRRL